MRLYEKRTNERKSVDKWSASGYSCLTQGGRDGRPVPYEVFLGAYLVDGTLSSGEGGNDTHGTLHENVAGHAGGTGNPSPTRVFDYAVLYR